MDKELFTEYATIKLQIKELEEKLDPLKEKIVAQIGECEDPIEIDEGTFTVSKRRKYIYPKEINDLEKKLKEEKVTAERIGSATYVENSVLMFKGSRD